VLFLLFSVGPLYGQYYCLYCLFSLHTLYYGSSNLIWNFHHGMSINRLTCFILGSFLEVFSLYMNTIVWSLQDRIFWEKFMVNRDIKKLWKFWFKFDCLCVYFNSLSRPVSVTLDVPFKMNTVLDYMNTGIPGSNSFCGSHIFLCRQKPCNGLIPY
jgi:hypothetical protein